MKAVGMTFHHIMGEAAVKPHPYTSTAKVVDDKLSYR